MAHFVPDRLSPVLVLPHSWLVHVHPRGHPCLSHDPCLLLWFLDSHCFDGHGMVCHYCVPSHLSRRVMEFFFFFLCWIYRFHHLDLIARVVILNLQFLIFKLNFFVRKNKLTFYHACSLDLLGLQFSISNLEISVYSWKYSSCLSSLLIHIGFLLLLVIVFDF